MGRHSNLLDMLDQRMKEIPVGDMALGGPSLLTYGTHNDSARMIMVNNHFTQRMVLNKTEFPRIFTNFENMVGSNSSYNETAQSNYEVYAIIDKFPNIPSASGIELRLLIVYDIDNDMYDIIERHDVENLVEKYGFQRDNSEINKYAVGDKINKGSHLSRATSFDEFDNYGYGVNVKFMYSIDDDIIEDAIKVSRRLQQRMQSTEVEQVKVSINDNDFLINMYGDDDNYKAFPDIGENVRDKMLCVKRRMHSNQVYFDMKTSNMSRPLASDVKSYIDGEVVDIDIYCNKPIDEIPRTNYNQQLIKYLEMQRDFYNRIKDVTQELIDNFPDKCGDAIRYYNKRAKQMTDPELKCRDENNSVFSNIVMYFTVKKVIGLAVGQKLTGRHGNKGVISKICEDYEMPKLENGEQVDIIFESLGVYNRLNVFQLFEQSITFIGDRAVEHMKKPGTTLKEKEYILFTILETFNQEEHDKLYNIYNGYTLEQKKEFFEITEKYGIYIHIKPFWHSENLYDAVMECYKKFDWLKPYKVYFYDEISNRYVRMINDQVVGSMYIMKLKQTSKKNLSVCAFAPISRFGIPEKTDLAKKHKTLHSRTAIRFGIQETQNSLISIDPEYTAKLHLFQRSSPIARRALGSGLLNNYGKGLPVEPEVTKEMTNRNVEILQAYMKFLGIRLNFDHDDIDLSLPDGQYTTHKYKGETYLASSEFMRKVVADDEVKRRMQEYDLGCIYVGSDGIAKDKFIDEMSEIIVENLESEQFQ